MTKLPAAVTLGVVAVVGVASLTIEAHKPITSPYTFAEDVLPILRDRCASCHSAGGPAPMALTTAEETIPWGESIRLELVAGHMPPWSAVANGRRLRHSEGLTARELNVLLTWVTGGTPPGDAKPAAPSAATPEWPLGPPDATLSLPEVGVAADQTEVTREIVLPLDAAMRRPLRAVDLRPGTRSLVRGAQIAVRPAPHASVEDLVGLWVPGDRPVALPAGSAFGLNGDLVVTLRLKKTWEHEREAMSDRSTLALYFAEPGAAPVFAFDTADGPAAPAPLPGGPAPTGIGGGNVTSETLAVPTRILAVYPTAAAAGATITIDATPKGGLMQRVIEFTPQRGWERRYWLDEPIDLPPGTRIQTSVKFDPLPAPPPSGPLVILNVVPAPPR
jgi:hypothetical protein